MYGVRTHRAYSSTHGGLKSKTYVVTKKGKIYLRHNSIAEDVPIAIALKALGIQSDKEILLLTAGTTEAYRATFAQNLEEAAKLGVFTRQQALDHIGTRVKVNRKVIGPRRPAWEEALEALATIVLAHVQVKGLDLRPKAIFVATMTRRVLMALDDEKMVDDRDYVGNKRLELCAPRPHISSDVANSLTALVNSWLFSSKTCSKHTIPHSNRTSTRSSKNHPERPNSTPTTPSFSQVTSSPPASFGPYRREIGLLSGSRWNVQGLPTSSPGSASSLH